MAVSVVGPLSVVATLLLLISGAPVLNFLLKVYSLAHLAADVERPIRCRSYWVKASMQYTVQRTRGLFWVRCGYRERSHMMKVD